MVVVPARNEAQNIGACLHSVLEAANGCWRGLWECRVVVTADSCQDDTAAIARSVLGDRGSVIEGCFGSVGMARRVGTALALQSLRDRPPSSIWLANTDADTIVPYDWLAKQLQLASSGFDGIAGTVRIGECRHEGRDVAKSLMADYRVEPDGTHAHVHGANLGVRADAYLRAGGWSNAVLAEDHCLWQRLQHTGARLATSATTCVQTSARLNGRAVGGFACTLRRKLEGFNAAAGRGAVHSECPPETA